MPKRDAKDVTSLRRTERMGMERDTLRDLPAAPDVGAQNFARATVPMAHAPRGKGPKSDRVEGGEIKVASGEISTNHSAELLDLSKLGPRHAKTMKVPKRPQEFLSPVAFDSASPDSEAGARSPAKRRSPTLLFGTALIVLLALLAVVLLLLIGKQRGLFG